MNFRKVNNITGWVVFVIASLVYILTAEKSGSFWDCGEFVASAYKAQLPHPPGAPLFVLLGRFFIILFGDNPANAAKAVNIMSAFASGATILFLFWTITHFARKLVVGNIEEPNDQQSLTILGAGIVGALAYTFTDSFWFSAVEGEVYALSSFFTAIVFWAILKWERADDLAGNNVVLRNRADRWIVFIFFMQGLSIGVHLLGILSIPAIVMVYYFKRYKYSRKGSIWAFLIGCAITGVVQVAVIQWTVKFAGKFDIFFVNDFNLPFFSGFVFFFVLLGALIWFGLRVAARKSWSFLRLGLWCFIFMLIGYSTYVTTLERSTANPAIDMNNVDNPMSLVYYLGREQYGSQPVLYGPHFQAEPVDNDGDGMVDVTEGEMKYTKGKDKYIPIGKDMEYKFDSKDYQLFVRVWDRSNDQGHADFYAQWLGLAQEPDGRGGTRYAAPTYADNIKWFVTYQMGFMYWRYFMWNFAGKQNDIQGSGNKRDGNWITGLSFIDNVRLGDQSKLPDSIKDNKAHNQLFLLPFILGLIGCVYQFFSDRKDWIVSFLLFFFTGLAIVLYLNQPGNQPRERDYAYVGSFYVFAIWIGLAVPALVRMAREDRKQLFMPILMYGSITAFIVALLSNASDTMTGAFTSSVMITAVFAAVTAILYYLIKAVSSKQTTRTASIVAFAACMLAPVIMAFQEWDDHDRSQKTLAPDIAKDYLESCEKNAILITFGDNDTYPLWYAQEVEGVRPDIRIINYSLLGIDWYANQLRYRVNESAPIDIVWTPDQIEGHKREYLRYQAAGGTKDKFYDLYDVMKNVLGAGDNVNTFPVKRFIVPVDTAFVKSQGIVKPTDQVISPLPFELPENKNDLNRADLVILNMIAANNWKRPIYFTSPWGDLGLGQYLRKDGLTYRLLPVRNKFPQQNWVVDQALRGTAIRDNNEDWMYDKLMNKFKFGGADKNGVYFDEENRRHLLSIRSTYGEAAGNLADDNKKQEAVNLLKKAEAGISTNNLPYAMVSRYSSHNQTALIYLEAAYKAGDTQLAQKIGAAIKKDIDDQRKYYEYLKNEKEDIYEGLAQDAQINEMMQRVLDTVQQKYTQKQPVNEVPEQVDKAADTTNTKETTNRK